jgi:hypothetical protein
MLNTAACQKDVTILVVGNIAAKSSQAFISFQISPAKGHDGGIKIKSGVSEDTTFSYTLESFTFTTVPN